MIVSLVVRVLGLLVPVVLPIAAAAAPPVIALENSTHVITFTTPAIYDFTVNDSSSDGAISNATLISHDVNGKIEGIIIDQGNSIELTTEIVGKCKRQRNTTVVTTKLVGDGDLGNGGLISSLGRKRAEVRGSGASATLHSKLRLRTCVTQRKPLSEKTFTKCVKGGGTTDAPFGLSGGWQMRLELQQPAVGEVLGTGSITTRPGSAQYARTTDVIAAGQVRKNGTAKIKLTPIHDGGDGPVTVTAEVVAGPGVQWPAVIKILQVKGKLLGQKFTEGF